MLELLFLLLPIAAIYGWYMGHRSAQQKSQNSADKLSREYVTGVNFLLSNQKDEAVNLFLDMLKTDQNTLEAHLTLGNLFRSRGEVDRAIRIHQTLLESASLSFEQRLLAVMQLGRDYMVAGLYDRAEEMFLQLTEEDNFKVAALQQLLLIYQAMSEWGKAILVAEKLIKLGKNELQSEIAQFYCEQATLLIATEEVPKAINLLKKALSAYKNCVRASIMLGRVYIGLAQYKQAAEELTQVIDQDKDYVSEVLPLLQQCYHHLAYHYEWIAFLKRCVSENTGPTAELMMADELEGREGKDVAQMYMSRELQRSPSMKGFYRLMNYHLADAEEGRAKESLILLRNMVGEQIRQNPHYRCMKCGFTVNTLYWHCPGCRSWSTIKPIRDFTHHK